MDSTDPYIHMLLLFTPTRKWSGQPCNIYIQGESNQVVGAEVHVGDQRFYHPDALFIILMPCLDLYP